MRKTSKKNLRKIPEEIFAKLKSFMTDDIAVGCALNFKAEDIAAGALIHLGIQLTGKALQVPENILPSPDQGRYSARNIDGFELKRKDLPMETRYHAVETPNWGRSGYGTHTVFLPHEAYPVEFHSPRELLISMRDLSPPSASSSWFIIGFRVDETLSKKSPKFKNLLLDNLNLLQENVGACGVEPAEATLSEYMKSLHVSWEILPPGTREETIDRLFRGRMTSPETREVAGDRHDFFASLKPKRLVFGSSGFRRYFGALLEDDLVVFENIEYGNAIYVLFDKWEDLSKRSRTDLLKGQYGTNFERVIHRSGWKGAVRKIVAARRNRGE